MNSTALSIADEIAQLPEAGFREAMRSLALISQRYFPSITMTDEDERDLALAAVEAAHGDFATDQEVAAAFRQIHAAVGL